MPTGGALNMRKMMLFVVVITGICISAVAFAQFSVPPLKAFAVDKNEVAKLAKTEAVIETKFGNITLRFFPDTAPGHVKNFVELAKKGFYNGSIFHRVIPGFMIQGGDPTGTGTGGPGYTIKAEFNARPHKRGTLSMARTNMPDTAGSQFFFCVADAPMLNNQYSVFGEVVSGMEVVDKIVSQPRNSMDKPNERIEMKVKIVEGK
jgi:cyclophilin family peptidyl-prolyl cis-trans isomerase